MARIKQPLVVVHKPLATMSAKHAKAKQIKRAVARVKLSKQTWKVDRVVDHRLFNGHLQFRTLWVLKPSDPKGTSPHSWEYHEGWKHYQDRVNEYINGKEKGGSSTKNIIEVSEESD